MKKFILITTAILTLISCSDDDNLQSSDQSSLDAKVQINNFIFEGLNLYYVYKDEQPLLNNRDFALNQADPEDYFELLTVPKDRFSFIVDDYEVLENSFAGISVSDGIDFTLTRIEEGSDDLIAYVNYVANDSPGRIAGVERGDFFTTIDGTRMNINNYLDLLDLNSYSLELLTFNENTNQLEDKELVNITKVEFIENPIHINKIIEHEGLQIGYIMYNQFIAGSENELNTIFAEFKAAGIDQLILDLRYNGGGRVSTAVDLAGMITGQYSEQVLISEQWNSELQEEFTRRDPEFLVTRFRDVLTDEVTLLNSLNLKQLYVISSKRRTASASELVINGLDAYINVVHIGDEEGTVGKSQASFTLFDSDNLFSKEGINNAHKYAIQPLVYTSANKDGTIVPNEGLTPDVFIEENNINLGVLGETSDPLLNAALNSITGGSSSLAAKTLLRSNPFGSYVGNSGENSQTYQRMYDYTN